MIKTKAVEDKVFSPKLTRKSKIVQNEWQQFWKENECVPSLHKYNMTICDDPKFIWFRNAKVGTRSTLAAFKNAGVKLTAEHAFDCFYSPQKYRDYFKFAFVRNPWDRFVSGWVNKFVNKNAFNFNSHELNEMKQFEHFVTYWSEKDLDSCNAHFRRQCALIDLNEVDFIGRMEHFNKDLTAIFRILDLPEIQIPFRNKSKREYSYNTYYDSDTKRMVSKMYRKDIQLFGYTY